MKLLVLLLLTLVYGAPVQRSSSYWYETIDHNGVAPYAPIDNYSVFRNVKDYGAKGDGISDDSAAIQAAINDGGRDSNPDYGTTRGPASVYFPAGTYLLKNQVEVLLDTVLIGDASNRPTLKADAGISSSTMINGYDARQPANNNFYKVVKHFVLDSTAVDASKSFLVLDWSVSQATQLTDVQFLMPFNSQHIGVGTPSGGGGSGTYMGDLSFQGGAVGIDMNNQQYNIKSVAFNGCTTGISYSHGFTMVFQNLSFHDCGVGIDATQGTTGNVGSLTVLDSSSTETGAFVKTVAFDGNDGTSADTIMLQNIQVDSAGVTVQASGNNILKGSVSSNWVYGNTFHSVSGEAAEKDASLPAFVSNGRSFSPSVPGSQPLLVNGKYLTKAPPTYTNGQQVVNIKSVPDLKVFGDGHTDDTSNINQILRKNAQTGAVTFFPAGIYIVTDTVQVPPNSRIVGEAWSTISARGSKFNDTRDPQVMFMVGNPNDSGVAEISDMLFTVDEELPGCILVEVNMAGTNPGDVGLWNSHIRVGGAWDSQIRTTCTDPANPCMAAFALLHLGQTASAYIEDMWGWNADHDLDGTNPQAIGTGRGALIESTNPSWLLGTAFEHAVMYQYNLNKVENLYIGMQQTETPYWQGIGSSVLAPAPWTPGTIFADPDFSNCDSDDAYCRMAWHQVVNGGSNLQVYGSAFWTFFDNLGGCQGQDNTCQLNAVSVDGTSSDLNWYNLNTRACLNLMTQGATTLVSQAQSLASWGAGLTALSL